MKADVLTLAALVFVVGVILSSVTALDLFASEEAEVPTELQRGFMLQR